MSGECKEYSQSNTSDTFLVQLHQDWLLARSLFGSTPRTTKMIEAIEVELSKRNINPVPYEWVPPKVYEVKEANNVG